MTIAVGLTITGSGVERRIHDLVFTRLAFDAPADPDIARAAIGTGRVGADTRVRPRFMEQSIHTPTMTARPFTQPRRGPAEPAVTDGIRWKSRPIGPR